MSKVQCNQKFISGEGHKLNTCPLQKDLIKNKTNKGKTYKKGFRVL
jgi:hypothetical protein